MAWCCPRCGSEGGLILCDTHLETVTRQDRFLCASCGELVHWACEQNGERVHHLLEDPAVPLSVSPWIPPNTFTMQYTWNSGGANSVYIPGNATVQGCLPEPDLVVYDEMKNWRKD